MLAFTYLRYIIIVNCEHFMNYLFEDLISHTTKLTRFNVEMEIVLPADMTVIFKPTIPIRHYFMFAFLIIEYFIFR